MLSAAALRKDSCSLSFRNRPKVWGYWDFTRITNKNSAAAAIEKMLS